MRTHSHVEPLMVNHSDRWLAARFLRDIFDRFLLLPFGALLALAWANTDAEGYFRFSHANAFWVNEIAMALFLALIAQELFEALMPAGELRHWHHWGLSVIAAAGGLAGSLATFWVVIDVKGEMVLAAAWPVAAAVDLAAGYYVMRMIYPRRAAPVALVLLIAALSDAVAMAAVTLSSASFQPNLVGLVLVGLAIGFAVMLRGARVSDFTPYVLCGAASWFGCYSLGIHPALSLIPLVPIVPHEVRTHNLFSSMTEDDDVHRAESAWNAAAQIAVFMFGLVNAGVIIKAADTGSWAVLIAALVGRPAGILIAVALAMTAGLTLPRRMRIGDLVVAALATTSGFTFALFLGSVAIPAGAVLQQVTLGALATAAGALLTIGVARLLGVGRYHSTERQHGVLSETRLPSR